MVRSPPVTPTQSVPISPPEAAASSSVLMKTLAVSPGAQSEGIEADGGTHRGSPPLPPTTQAAGSNSSGNSSSSATQQQAPDEGKEGASNGRSSSCPLEPACSIEESTTPQSPFPIQLDRRAHSVAAAPTATTATLIVSSASHDPIGSPVPAAAASLKGDATARAEEELPPLAIKRHASQPALPSSIPILLAPAPRSDPSPSPSDRLALPGGRKVSAALSDLSLSAAVGIETSSHVHAQQQQQQQQQRKGSRLTRRRRGRRGSDGEGGHGSVGGSVGGSVSSSVASALGGSSVYYYHEEGGGASSALVSGAAASTTGGGGEDGGLGRSRYPVIAEIPTPADPKEYDLIGTLFKRRGGIGRLLGWRPRLFTLYKGKLCYYEAEIVEDVEDRRKPRGVFDLASRGVAYVLQESWPKQERPPTDFVFTIYGQEDDQKWKMCAPSKEDLEDWCKALSAYLGPPAIPGDFQATHGIDIDRLSRSARHRRKASTTAAEPALATSPTNYAAPPAFDSPTHHKAGGRRGPFGGRVGSVSGAAKPLPPHHRPHASSSASPPAIPAEEATTTTTTTTGKTAEPPATVAANPLPSSSAAAAAPPVVMMTRLNSGETTAVLAATNLLLLGLRCAHPVVALAVALALNLVLVEAISRALFTGPLSGRAARLVRTTIVDPLLAASGLLLKWAGDGGGACHHAPMMATAADAPAGGAAVAEGEGEGVGGGGLLGAVRRVSFSAAHSQHEAAVVPRPPTKLPPIGASIPRALDDGNMPEHSWTLGCSSNIRVRGVGYKQTSRKEASAPAIYELANFDFIRSRARISHVGGTRDDLPTVEGAAALPPHIPPVLIVSWQAPSEKPSLMAQEDGPGWSCIMYFAVKKEMIPLFQDVEKAPPGVKLYLEFMKKAFDTSNPAQATEWRDRFKAICLCKNMEEMGLPSFIAQCNGKPILVKHTANYYKGPGYAEININMHKFAYLARKGIQILQGKIKLMAFECAFTVEGRTDEELPEVVMGVGKFNKIDVRNAMSLEG